MIRIIAEAGINHNGRLEEARRLVDAAHAAGADMVKFQIYHTANLVRHVDNYDLLRRCELADGAYVEIKQYCDSLGIEWMASCFDRRAVDLAAGLGAKTIKLGSGEIVNHDLIRHVRSRGVDLMLSTGASNLHEIFEAAMVFNTWHSGEGRYRKLSLLHCVSLYPAPLEGCNLKAITTLKKNFFCPVGWSDHTTGFDSAVIAVGAGADIIERHIMLTPECPDAAVSLSPENFRGYVATIRRAEQMMGHGEKSIIPEEEAVLSQIRGRWHVSSDSSSGREGSQSGQGDPPGRATHNRQTR